MGLTSRDLVIPITLDQDTVGPLARTVRDAATVLSIIAGIDEYHGFTKLYPMVANYQITLPQPPNTRI
jgi:amidase